ncbi:MAG: CHAT domain-containing protein [Microcoleaceae cyanobacterium]
MLGSDTPCLSLALKRLNIPESNYFAIWVLNSSLPNSYVHHDCPWPDSLSHVCQAWLEMFSPHSLSERLSTTKPFPKTVAFNPVPDPGRELSYSSRLMQQLGISLWQWLFEEPVQSSFYRSQGIAIGQDQPLRIRLDIREPDLIPLPWEIMQPQAGQPAISLSQLLPFSRTTYDVNPLIQPEPAQTLNILLVLGDDQIDPTSATDPNLEPIQLEQQADQLKQVLERSNGYPLGNLGEAGVRCQVTTLVQPTVAELIAQLETNTYNVLFYGGHGQPAPDGGLLFLSAGTTINGTELAQVLVRCGVTLAVFNACWGAQPASLKTDPTTWGSFQAIPSSSLAKVLIHHGVPAVLGMRDSITDQEALSFIQALTQALAKRMYIDQAVAVARQQLLTLYKFNQPAWTLPVLYMHPQFDGVLVQPLRGTTIIPHHQMVPKAWLRLVDRPESQSSPYLWPIGVGTVRVGRSADNDVVVSQEWVSSKHANIFCRDGEDNNKTQTYFLQDYSRYGTWISTNEGWQKIFNQEVVLLSGTQLRFGSDQGQTLEFIVDE